MQLHFRFSGLDLRQKLPGGYPQHTTAQAGKLHQRVGGCHPDGVIGADFCRQGFDVSIGGLPFGGVYDADIVPNGFGTVTAFFLIAVKNQNQDCFFEPGLAA